VLRAELLLLWHFSVAEIFCHRDPTLSTTSVTGGIAALPYSPSGKAVLFRELPRYLAAMQLRPAVLCFLKFSEEKIARKCKFFPHGEVKLTQRLS
jgi:hypothetical protein